MTLPPVPPAGRVTRILGVLALLVALGAISGFVVGGLFLIGLQLVNEHRLVLDARMLAYAAGFGAAVGAVSGPPIALLFLRRVPLWRATVEIAAVAAIGAAIGGFTRYPFSWAVTAFAFAIADALRLRHVYRARPALNTPEET